MAKRGRPKKIQLSLEDQCEEVILKAYDVDVKGDGSLKFTRNSTPLSLEETSLALWMMEGKKGKPLTKTGIMKIEQNALLKMRLAFIKQGFNPDDVLGAIHDREKRSASERTVCSDWKNSF